MPKRKNEVVKQIKEASRVRIGKLPSQKIIPNKKRDAKYLKEDQTTT